MKGLFLKEFEVRGKRFLVPLLATPFKVRPSSMPVLDNNSSVLFLRHDRIGDMIISTGIFSMLKKKFPDIRIGVIASSRNAMIIEGSPDVDALYVYDKRPMAMAALVRSIRKARYSFVVNLVLYSSLTGGLLAALSAGSWAFRMRMTMGDDLDFFYHRNCRKTIWGNATRTMLEETAAMAGELGVTYTTEEVRPVLRIPQDLLEQARAWRVGLGPGPVIGVNLASGVPEREAPAVLWKGIIELFSAQHPSARFILLTPPHGNVFEQLKILGIPACAQENPPHQGIMGAAALIATMDAVVSADTAIPHICSALNIPVLVLYHCVENSVLWAPSYKSGVACAWP